MAYTLWPTGLVLHESNFINNRPCFRGIAPRCVYPFVRDDEYLLWQRDGRWAIGRTSDKNNTVCGPVLLHLRGDYDDCYAPPSNTLMKWGRVRFRTAWSDSRLRLVISPEYSRRRHWSWTKHRRATEKTKATVLTTLLCAARLRSKSWSLPTEMWLCILEFIPARLGRTD